MADDYTPISCDFYDELTVRATFGKTTTIIVREGDEEVALVGVIADVYTEGEAEYLRLRSGQVIRLDRLVSVDGIPLPPAC